MTDVTHFIFDMFTPDTISAVPVWYFQLVATKLQLPGFGHCTAETKPNFSNMSDITKFFQLLKILSLRIRVLPNLLNAIEPQTICHLTVKDKVAEQHILGKYCNCNNFGVTMDLLNSQNFRVAITQLCNVQQV